VAADFDGTLAEVSRLLRRLEMPDVDLPGAAWLAVTLRAVADAQARLFRSIDFHVKAQENAIMEIRQQNHGENARRNAKLVDLTEILAGHGTVLVELQQYRKDEPTRRRSLKAELEARFQGQDAVAVQLVQRVDAFEGMLTELSQHGNHLAEELHQTRCLQVETIAKCQEETQRRGKIVEDVQFLQQQAQVSNHSLAELQRSVAGRQRSRVRQLEAELSWSASANQSAEASPLQSASSRVASPNQTAGRGGSLVASTGVAVLPSKFQRDSAGDSQSSAREVSLGFSESGPRCRHCSSNWQQRLLL